MMSLVPFIILAGFFESYVTANYNSLADWTKWFFIILCFAIIIFYYVIYPTIVARKYPHLLHDEEVVNSFPDKKFDLHKIRTFGQVISDSFKFYRLHFGKFARVNIFLLFPLILIFTYFQNQNHLDLMQTNHWFDWSKQLEIMMGFGYKNPQDLLVNFGWLIIFSLMILAVSYSFRTIEEDFSWKAYFIHVKNRIFQVIIGALIIFYVFNYTPWYWYFFLLFITPFIYLNSTAAGLFDKEKSSLFSLGWKYSAKSYGNSIMSILVFTLIFALFMQPIAFVGSIHDGNLLSSPPIRDLLDMLSDFVKNVCETFGWNRWFWSNYTRQIVYILFILLVFPLWLISTHFLAYNEHEKETATGLRIAFKKFGKRSRVQENELDYE